MLTCTHLFILIILSSKNINKKSALALEKENTTKKKGAHKRRLANPYCKN
jgi:hypothetical protein